VTRLRLGERLTHDELAWLQRLGQVAQDAGAKAYLVGGPVRDLILGRPAPDTDLAVEGPVEDVAHALAAEFGGHVKKTTDLLTATVVLADGREIDVAHARTETYSEPGALPEVSPASLEDDLRRRDFTVNAMALALSPSEFGRLIDPHGGHADLRAGLLRVLHERSFEDDPTRMLRAARFQQGLGLRLEPGTRELLARAAAERRLEPLSGARLRAELRRILADDVPEGFAGLQELGLLAAMGLPEAGPEAVERMRLLPQAVERLGEKMEQTRPLAMCLGLYAASARFISSSRRTSKPVRRSLGGGGPANAVLDGYETASSAGGLDPVWLGERLMLDAGERADLAQAARLAADPPAELTEPRKDSDLHFALEGTGLSGAAACWTAVGADARTRLEHYWRELRGITADIDGQDLIAAGHEPGAGFSAALRAALAAKLDTGGDRDAQRSAALRALADYRTTDDG